MSDWRFCAFSRTSPPCIKASSCSLSSWHVDANERRDWCIWTDLAAVLIARANKLYVDAALGLDVNITGNVYALDSTTIDCDLPCLTGRRFALQSGNQAAYATGLA